MKNLTSIIFAASMAASGGVSANIIIDDFTQGQFATSVLANSVTTSQTVTQGGLNTANVIGGVRESSVQYVAGPGNTSINVSSNNLANTPRFTFSQDQDTSGRAQLWWDGIANGVNDGLGGALNAALAPAGNAFSFRASTEINATPGAYTVQILIYSDSGLSAVQFDAVDTAGNYTPVLIPFADFVNIGGGGADFNDVDAIFVGFNTNSTARITVDVGVEQINVPVPEPGALALASLALLGLWGTTRRRRQG